MKTMFDVERLGASNKMKVLAFLMLCAIWAMVWTFVKVGHEVETDQLRLADAGEQLVLSQRIAKYALSASTGEADAFVRLEASKNKFSAILDSQMAAYGDVAGEKETPESLALVNLDNHWRGFRNNIDEVLEGQFLIMAMTEATSLMNEVMPQLMEHTSGIVDELMKNGASAAEVRLATEQAVLGQRIVNSLNAVMTGKVTESAAVAFAEDTREFGRVLDGFMRGTGGIQRLKGDALQSRIQKIALLFSRVSDNVGSIVENAEEIVGIQTAAAEITAQSESLFEAVEGLKSALLAAPAGRIVSTELAYFLGAVALLMLFLMAYETLVSQRRRSRLIEEENSRNQEAIMRLLDEIGDLAAGDLTVKTTVSEDFTGAIADSINVTVESLRALVKTINDTSTQLSSSVHETEQIASQLSEASKRQSQDISIAGTSITEMSVSMDDVSNEASESSKVAMRSVEIAKKGGEAVKRTMDGMDNIREHIQETSKRIKRLGESSQEIGDIVELINDIAEQTNILALNASIQAAMAGEAGRGFAVVADEVQRLAERSANATKQIEALVKTIQADTHEAVISMEKSTAGVVNGAQIAEDAGSALEEIESVSDQLAGLIQNISSSARQQANVATQLAASMNSIQEMTTQASAGTEQTARSIGNLSRLAHDLDVSVTGFKLPQ
ncbi:MAG: methyl-accepting chemotaxis protein [Gammaproteobacteria bacterium]|jgi:twitching motility protein PilJ|nr:methyl-accepting chemotaxis protein [Gammaproteobacteria bacterium]